MRAIFDLSRTNEDAAAASLAVFVLTTALTGEGIAPENAQAPYWLDEPERPLARKQLVATLVALVKPASIEAWVERTRLRVRFGPVREDRMEARERRGRYMAEHGFAVGAYHAQGGRILCFTESCGLVVQSAAFSRFLRDYDIRGSYSYGMEPANPAALDALGVDTAHHGEIAFLAHVSSTAGAVVDVTLDPGPEGSVL